MKQNESYDYKGDNDDDGDDGFYDNDSDNDYDGGDRR